MNKDTGKIKKFKRVTVDFYLDEEEVELLEELVKEHKERYPDDEYPFGIEQEIGVMFRFELIRVRLERKNLKKMDELPTF